MNSRGSEKIEEAVERDKPDHAAKEKGAKKIALSP
jgi:hypothetical protein